MIKLAIPAVVGLLLGLGASTGAVVFLSGGNESLGEELETAMVDEHGDTIHTEASDSTHGAEVAVGDSTHAEELHDGEGLVDDLALAASGLTPGAMDAMAAQDPAAQAMSALTATPPPSRGMSTSQLSSLFATMSAREAAKVLEHMEDEEVQIILSELEPREAASILSNLSPERAAVVSRSVLRGERNTQ